MANLVWARDDYGVYTAGDFTISKSSGRFILWRDGPDISGGPSFHREFRGSLAACKAEAERLADSEQQYNLTAEPFPVPVPTAEPMPSTDRVTSQPIGRFGEETDPLRPTDFTEEPVFVGNVGFDGLYAWSDNRLSWNRGGPCEPGPFFGIMDKGEARKARKMLRAKGLTGHSSERSVSVVVV